MRKIISSFNKFLRKINRAGKYEHEITILLWDLNKFLRDLGYSGEEAGKIISDISYKVGRL